MFDENEETFTYMPTSFVTSKLYVNPDSPRHFKNKRRRHNTNSTNDSNGDKAQKLKNRPQSLIDFQFVGRKSATKKASECRRSKTVIERCRGAIRRAISMETLLDDDENSAESTALSRKKPTISRLKKLRDVRKGSGGSNIISLPLQRSKSEANLYHNQDYDNDDDDDDDGVDDDVMEKRQSIGSVSLTGPEKYVVQNILNDACVVETNLNRDSSISFDSLITHSTRSGGSATSSPNSSGFYECTGSELGSLSRGDSLSSNGSVGAFKKHRNQNSSSDKTSDKYTPEEECWDKDRKPFIVTRSTSKSKSRGRPKQQNNRRNTSPASVGFKHCPSSPSTMSNQSPVHLRNEVFTPHHEEHNDDQRDSGLDIPASNKISQRRPTPKHPKNKRGGWGSDELRAVDIQLDGPLDSASELDTNSSPCPRRTVRRESSSLEETVDKLTVSLRRTSIGYSNIGHSNSFHCSRYPSANEIRERKRVEKSRSVDNSSSYTLPSPVRRPDTGSRRSSYYGHIRIESVL